MADITITLSPTEAQYLIHSLAFSGDIPIGRSAKERYFYKRCREVSFKTRMELQARLERDRAAEALAKAEQIEATLDKVGKTEP